MRIKNMVEHAKKAMLGSYQSSLDLLIPSYFLPEILFFYFFFSATRVFLCYNASAKRVFFICKLYLQLCSSDCSSKGFNW